MKDHKALNPNWTNASVQAVVQAVVSDVKKYDEGSMIWDDLVHRITGNVEATITKTYDLGFEHGITAQVEDMEDETDEMQMEFDLDDLRQIGKDLKEGDVIDEAE